MRSFRVAVLCSATLLLITILDTHAQNTTMPSSLSPSVCDPAACGDLRIAYPFWLGGTHPPECGHRAFQVTCDATNRTAFLQNTFLVYQILGISYNDSSFTVANVGLSSDGPCTAGKLGVNASSDLALGPFGISFANQELFFLYNCTEFQSSQPPPEWAPIRCTNGFGPDETWRAVEGNCTVSMMPVQGYEGASGKDYRRLMQGGFLLNYTADDCTACEGSGGVCRVNIANENCL